MRKIFMRKKLINMMAMCLTILLAFSLSGCSNSAKKASAEKNYKKTIGENLII